MLLGARKGFLLVTDWQERKKGTESERDLRKSLRLCLMGFSRNGKMVVFNAQKLLREGENRLVVLRSGRNLHVRGEKKNVCFTALERAVLWRNQLINIFLVLRCCEFLNDTWTLEVKNIRLLFICIKCSAFFIDLLCRFFIWRNKISINENSCRHTTRGIKSTKQCSSWSCAIMFFRILSALSVTESQLPDQGYYDIYQVKLSASSIILQYNSSCLNYNSWFFLKNFHSNL